ncbi:MAG: hypothetical protein ACD_52C00087G0003 [uncultured bacterium]|uniref:Uncharacterized protein n=1 Tax=Candidatus Woesebacteria bacterium RIFCSPHIGHO2_12_FULL_41_24 TaxID=1802510 RepID=A0A1F8AVP0_9BACT|nr:MAG: hypothetical protein ACD_52C00087G0003 [uncultured bacterium]OGM14233.1 MAG: hypothetical protein A2W15_04155 [Candidatus Woesebacteria bacterium RBG_16_41_13]OGM29103.1 MAG: hypothetical protein A2873_00010 [Candidatus Woesebacteria bacterium RIFCSPHIGHO2_01_FULL_42_80]OGM35694.1 MAG: hypothetical protein A3D84_04000 [Candidatus Woesebacteria bacterium RIFCSPHIGHO2_02_FULL_42_20]OGM55305.1 MAG: hypothetical protein A3E44_03410 [Candidatus Woesebacteria bacterium RIFCSPHIGHO2_12_FULL_41
MLKRTKGWLKLKKFWAIVIVGILITLFISRQGNNGWAKGVIQKGDIKEELTLSGVVEADEHIKLVFSTSGKIASVDVIEGQKVAKNQQLAKLDTTLLHADYERAVSDLRDAQSTVDRALDSVKNHDKDESFTQKETRTQAEVARDKAYRNLVKAQQNLAEAVLRSPFDGIVSQIVDIKPGINIIYTQSFIEVINPETIYFSVAADQTDVSKITLGQPADIVFDIDQDKSYSAEIIFVALTPKLDETSTVYKVKLKVAEVENLVSNIKVGMTGDANFTISEKANALFVEEKFVQQDKSGEYLLTGANKEKVNIETGIEGDGVVEVIGNVHEGQEIYDQP